MRCSDIMKTDVKCCAEDTSIQSVAQTMRDEGIGFCPVCDDEGKPIGTLTDRDIVIRVVADNQPADQVKAHEIATPDPISCRPEDDLDEAQALMRDNQISRILVCDEAGKLAGVISLSDLAEETELAQETLRSVAEREIRPGFH
jgi:CBS domain-containing protein